jgi:hypothetical protein
MMRFRDAVEHPPKYRLRHRQGPKLRSVSKDKSKRVSGLGLVCLCGDVDECQG